MKFKIEKIANIIYISTIEDNVIFKAWDERDFTERKLKNAINKIKKEYNENVKFIKCF